MATVLVTGGAGYIGTHLLVVLQQAGHHVLVLDNFSNAAEVALDRVTAITGQPVTAWRADVRDRRMLRDLFGKHTVDHVIHLAGLKAVGESVTTPLTYIDNNVGGSVALLEEMARAGVRSLVFSSTATVYGEAVASPVGECAPTGGVTSPYARSKLMVEDVLADVAAADPRWQIAVLRYFNPVGAHPSGCIGEDPLGTPNNLMPILSQVAVGRRSSLAIYGNDYPTRDGTGVRDYLHVMDLAEGHLRAMEHMTGRPGWRVWNLGTGRGASVLEVLREYEAVLGRSIPHRFVARRPGDIAEYYADPGKAQRELGWQATRTLTDMVRDAWQWQARNPHGYSTRQKRLEASF
ncbi:UDP-glucose 4-epimerase GalE [Halomonas ventosae]|uniref:UDP-glucose 4-epimerase n=1 Tax=Halomonas ventosae TaxID=229007 RepID=A0A4V3C0J3_9GAMM|nr:UDP-glucose 4-epimerase GalE [Halomonas ventosae]TDO10659.1 UDP-galactose 4-epimerase [Halomonas ventosae]